MSEESKQYEFLDIITILSFLIGLQNVSLNEKQMNDLNNHLKAQDDVLLKKISVQNDRIIELLEEIKSCTRN